MTGSPSTAQIEPGVTHTSAPASETMELAHAFDRAHHNQDCTGKRRADSFVDPSSDEMTALSVAVRAFVSARRADGSPPNASSRPSRE